jgi:hypothetical protein
VEILALRHQIEVLERQLGQQRVHFTAAGRALLAALLHRLPRQTLRRLRLLVRPDTVLRWHRVLIVGRHAVRSRPKRPGRPPTCVRSASWSCAWARENPGWGLTGVRMPRMNAITERWVHTCRRELPGRTLIWNQHHLPHALREFEAFYNTHRPHQGIANARPLRPLPPPITDRDEIAHLDIRRHQRLGGILNEYRHAA